VLSRLHGTRYLFLSPEPFAIIENLRNSLKLSDLMLRFARQIHKGELAGVVQTPRLPAKGDPRKPSGKQWVRIGDLAQITGLSPAQILAHAAFIEHGYNLHRREWVKHQIRLCPSSSDDTPVDTAYWVAYTDIMRDLELPGWASFWVPLSFAKMVQRLHTLGFDRSADPWRRFTA
jgi:hypothetical protein